MTSLLLLTPPATEPITLAEAKAHLRVEVTDDDALITALIAAVRQSCEAFTGRALISQTWRLWLDRASAITNVDATYPWNDDDDSGNIVPLPRAPLQNVTSISSFAEDGTETVFSAANYYIDAASLPGRLVLKDNASWPAILRRVAAIKIDFVVGYGDTAASVPAALIQGMKQHLAQLYANRGDGGGDLSLPVTTLALYQPYRIMQVAP